MPPPYMRKNLILIGLLALSLASLLLSLLYFSNQEYRREKIEEYRKKVEKRLRKPDS
ncbi:MAG: hypothetical protein NZL86_01010 [Aquificaceae bacterium]|nr:hypothetical protein [Aquificaceae bacterium]